MKAILFLLLVPWYVTGETRVKTVTTYDGDGSGRIIKEDNYETEVYAVDYGHNGKIKPKIPPSCSTEDAKADHKVTQRLQAAYQKCLNRCEINSYLGKPCSCQPPTIRSCL